MLRKISRERKLQISILILHKRLRIVVLLEFISNLTNLTGLTNIIKYTIEH